MSLVKEPEFDTRLLAGIRAALREARQLGYDVEQMEVTASVTGETAPSTSPPSKRPATSRPAATSA